MARPGKKQKRRDAAPAPFREPAPPPPAAPEAVDVSALDAPPTGDARRNALLGLGLWALVQIAIPLRYYLGSDPYDERFAWRMFSAVRVQECTIAVSETRAGVAVPLSPMSFLPAPWVGLLERSRPAVVRGFLDWRCRTGDEPPESVAVRSSCRDASGDLLPAVTRSLSCGERRYEESLEDAP